MDPNCFSSAGEITARSREAGESASLQGAINNIYYVSYKTVKVSFAQFGRDGIKRTGATLWALNYLQERMKTVSSWQ